MIQRIVYGGEMATPTREEINAEIAAAEARTDTKIVRLEGNSGVSSSLSFL
jgi:hypothetical protein